MQFGEQGAGQLLLGDEQFTGVGDGEWDAGGGRTGLDAADQCLQVGAVDGGVVETARFRARPGGSRARPARRRIRPGGSRVRLGAVAVGVEAAAAGPYDRALTAGLADPREPQLPCPHAGMGGHRVEGVGEDVESGGGGSLVGALEGVDLLQGSVGLDHDQIGGGEPQRLGEAGAAVQGGEHRLEEPYRHRAAPRVPAVEDGEQPVGVRGGGTVRARRWFVPGGVRQQEVDARRVERVQRVVHGDRVVGHVDGAEQSEIEVAVAVLPEQFDGLEDQGVAAAAVREAAVPVVGRLVAVEGDTHLDGELVEQVEVAGESWSPLVWIRRSRSATGPRARVSSSQTRLSRAGPASSGSPPCRITDTEGRAWVLACSASRRAVQEIASSEIALGRVRQL